MRGRRCALPIYTASIHPHIHQRSANQPTNQPSNNAAKPTNQPSNQQAKQSKPPIPLALRPPPHPLPPLFTQHPSIHLSIHPSIHQPSTQTEKIAYPSSTVSHKQPRQANQQTNTPKSYIFLSVHDPSLYAFSPNPSKQQAKQAEPTNTPTKGRIVKKGG